MPTNVKYSPSIISAKTYFQNFLSSSSHINNISLNYCDNEKDLGIVLSNRFSFNNHHKEIPSKAVDQFNLVRRTCHFIKNSQKRKTLYLTLIRSIFEHGSQIWNPNGSTAVCKFENFQISGIKWILHEQFVPHYEVDYPRKLSELKILPLEQKFILSDLMIFHKFVFKHIPLELPYQIVPQRSCTTTNTNSSIKYRLVNEIAIKIKRSQIPFLSVPYHIGTVYLNIVEI